MKPIIALIFSLIISTSLFASEIDWPAFDRAFSTKAQYDETPYGFFATLTRFEEVAQNTTQVNYFSSIGGFNDSKEFIATRYEIASEKWELVDENWHIDQWLFVFNTDHKLTFMLHRLMIQTPNRVVIKLENVLESDETYEQKANSILVDWAKNL